MLANKFLECPYCDREDFDDQDHLDQHISDEHQQDTCEHSLPSRSKISGGGERCDECGLEFSPDGDGDND